MTSEEKLLYFLFITFLLNGSIMMIKCTIVERVLVGFKS